MTSKMTSSFQQDSHPATINNNKDGKHNREVDILTRVHTDKSLHRRSKSEYSIAVIFLLLHLGVDSYYECAFYVYVHIDMFSEV